MEQRVGRGESGCRLMVVVATGAAAGERLAAALGAGEVTSVVVVPGANVPAAEVQALLKQAQAAGAAALVQDDARLARTLRADGVHLSAGGAGSKAYGEAREIVGSGMIVGVDAGRSRHEAMTAGELGADYVAFGIPEHVGDHQKAHTRRCELVAWWAEIFEVPVVAFDVVDADETGDVVAAGADFVAVKLPAQAPPAASGELVRAAQATIAGEVVS